MKLFAALLISSFTFTAFGATVSETIQRIEQDNNATCSRVDRSRDLCLGFAVDRESRELIPCWRTETFECHGEGAFQVKLKVKETYNSSTGKREGKVTKTTFSVPSVD